jgi:hypothetical protein
MFVTVLTETSVDRKRIYRGLPIYTYTYTVYHHEISWPLRRLLSCLTLGCPFSRHCSTNIYISESGPNNLMTMRILSTNSTSDTNGSKKNAKTPFAYPGSCIPFY